jgi:hypothetical protein
MRSIIVPNYGGNGIPAQVFIGAMTCCFRNNSTEIYIGFHSNSLIATIAPDPDVNPITITV